jgi:hypothetical protein
MDSGMSKLIWVALVAVGLMANGGASAESKPKPVAQTKAACVDARTTPWCTARLGTIKSSSEFQSNPNYSGNLCANDHYFKTVQCCRSCQELASEPKG